MLCFAVSILNHTVAKSGNETLESHRFGVRETSQNHMSAKTIENTGQRQNPADHEHARQGRKLLCWFLLCCMCSKQMAQTHTRYFGNQFFGLASTYCTCDLSFPSLCCAIPAVPAGTMFWCLHMSHDTMVEGRHDDYRRRHGIHLFEDQGCWAGENSPLNIFELYTYFILFPPFLQFSTCSLLPIRPNTGWHEHRQLPLRWRGCQDCPWHFGEGIAGIKDVGVSWNGGTPTHHPFLDGFSRK